MAVNVCSFKNKQLKMTVLNKRRTKFATEVNCFNIVFLLCCLLCCVNFALGVVSHTKECNTVKIGFMSRGFNASDLLTQPVNGQYNNYFISYNFITCLLFIINIRILCMYLFSLLFGVNLPI